MSSLRKLKRKETVPKLNKAKKYTKELLTRSRVANAALDVRKNQIYRQCVAIVNTCVLEVLRDIFGYSAKKCCRLCGRMSNISECIRLGYVRPFEILLNIQQETCWEYRRRNVDGLKGGEITATGMANDLIDREKERSFEQMEIMWIEALRLQEGFSRIRLARFIDKLRKNIKTFTVDRAEKVNAWLADHKIELEGFSVDVFDEIKCA